MIDKPGRGDDGPYGDEFARAAALLVRHHGDDPEAVRIGLGLDNRVTPRRDALLFGFYAAAKGREAKGLRGWRWRNIWPTRRSRSSTPAVSRDGPSAAASVEARWYARSICPTKTTRTIWDCGSANPRSFAPRLSVYSRRSSPNTAMSRSSRVVSAYSRRY